MRVDNALINDIVNTDMDVDLTPMLPFVLITLICIGYVTKSLWAWRRFRL